MTKSVKKGFALPAPLEKIPTWIAVVAVALGREDGRWLFSARQYVVFREG